MVPDSQNAALRRAGRVLGLLAGAAGVLGAAYLLTWFSLGSLLVLWPAFLVLVAGAGAAAAWTDRTAVVWGAAVLLSVVAVAGMWSIGFLFAPAAVLTLGSAVALRLAGVPATTRQSILDDPPGMREAVVKTLAGAVGMVAGVALIYLGAFVRELFEPCAVETLACQAANTHWDGVAATLIGFALVGGGAWLIRRQLVVAGVVDAEQSA